MITTRPLRRLLNSPPTSQFSRRLPLSHINTPFTKLRVEYGRAEQSRAEQSRAEQSRAEQSRAEQSRAEQSRAEPSRAQEATLSPAFFPRHGCSSIPPFPRIRFPCSPPGFVSKSTQLVVLDAGGLPAEAARRASFLRLGAYRQASALGWLVEVLLRPLRKIVR
jgi:hypothetical protein